MDRFRHVKNIIFDLGEVIINVDHRLALLEFEKLGSNQIDALYSDVSQSEFFDEFEKGKISSSDFRNELRAYISIPVDDSQIDLAWNAMLLVIPQERMELLNVLKKKYRLFLLSNTNKIHVAAIELQLQENFGISDFSEIFEKVYYSFVHGLRKPEPGFFTMVLSENQLLAEETIFVDDKIENIESAKKLGIQGCLVSEGTSILDFWDI